MARTGQLSQDGAAVACGRRSFDGACSAAFALAVAALASGCSRGAPVSTKPDAFAVAAPAPAGAPTTPVTSFSAPKGGTPSPPGAGAVIGKPAPNFSLQSLDGERVELSKLRGKVVVLEWFNPDCPFVRRNHTQGPLKTMPREQIERGVVWLAINSAAPGKQGFGVEKNAEGKARYEMTYPVLLDESGDVGRLYGAKTTPHVFVIDGAGTLVFRGAVDNAQDGDPPGGEPFKNFVATALDDVRAGRPVATSDVASYGCSVKYAF